MPRDDDQDFDTDELEPNTDWETAEVPKAVFTARLHRQVPRPCATCGGGAFIKVQPHGVLAHALGIKVRDARLDGAALVCRQCGHIRWYVDDPERLLEDPGFAAVVVESRE